MPILQNEWKPLLEEEFSKPYYLALRQCLRKEYGDHVVYPKKEHIFNALHYTPYSQVKVVILGQDPYHGVGQAHGLCFSVMPGVPVPPSLVNIYKELATDLGLSPPDHGCLIPWAKRGVLLLNTVLTVRAGEAASHRKMGWETFTDRVIQLLNQRETPVVFFLWGKHAQEKRSLITQPHHLIVESPHPSPFSVHRGFFGSHPFSQANAFLENQGIKPINWRLPLRQEVRGAPHSQQRQQGPSSQ